MLFLPEEKNIDIALLKCEVEELQTYAKEQGYTEDQAKAFIVGSITNSIKAECESVLMPENETRDRIKEVLKTLGFKE